MMKRKLNRFLSVLLCMAMTIALLPATILSQPAVADDVLQETPLYFEVVGGSITVTLNKEGSFSWDIQYSSNNHDWATFSIGGVGLNLEAGERIYFRTIPANRLPVFSTDCYLYFNLSSMDNNSGYVNVGGNIMSLMSNDFANSTQIPMNYAFCNLFKDCTCIQDASDLLLPATTLTEGCYYGMFSGCSSLETAPALPAETLAEHCYDNMFSDCTALTAAPALPATTLAEYCYAGMFYGCTALTAAPALPATRLAEYCCDSMFRDCTTLTTAPALPATTLAEGCYLNMFSDCTALTAAPALPATTLAEHCYAFMFQRCTALTAAPALPATMLAEECYDSMFKGCTALTTAPALLPATRLVKGCYGSMFADCTALTAAPVLHAATLAEYCCGCMFDGCSRLHVTMVDTGGTIIIPSDGYVVNEYGDYPVLNMFNGCVLDGGALATPAVGEYIGGTFYTVTFNLNGHGTGTAPASQTILSGGLVAEPTPAPTADYFLFGGWYKEAACTNAWNFSTETVTADTTLYAKWTNKYLYSTTVSAKDNIWFNFIINNVVGNPNNNYHFTYSVAGADSAHTITDQAAVAEYESNLGKYRICIKLKPYQLADEVTVNMYDRDNNLVNTFTDAVRSYADRATSSATCPSAEKNAIATMLNYGAAVQVWQQYNTGNLANSVLPTAYRQYQFYN